MLPGDIYLALAQSNEAEAADYDVRACAMMDGLRWAGSSISIELISSPEQSTEVHKKREHQPAEEVALTSIHLAFVRSAAASKKDGEKRNGARDGRMAAQQMLLPEAVRVCGLRLYHGPG